MPTASILGSGPNGLAAAITLARAGVQTTLYERLPTLGGACSTAELTLPGFLHDQGASAFPMAAASPFFQSLPFDLPFLNPPAACAHPLDDGTAVLLHRTVADTVANLDPADARKYRSLMAPLAENFAALIPDLLGPVAHLPHHPLLLARFGLSALLPATALAQTRFSGPRARALFAGMAAHSVLPLTTPTSAAVGLVLLAAGHSVGWPILAGGAQSLTDALAAYLRSLSGVLHTSYEITELPATDLTLADITPRQLLRLAGSGLPPAYRRQLESFRYGAGSFKIDYALSGPIPWTAPECAQAATVHLGGSWGEIAASEAHFDTEKPFVLLVQPSLFDPTRAPEGKHTAWAYCHVPNGSALDHTEALERQITRFAPSFRDVILARTISPPAALEAWNPNLVGGDLSGGAMTPQQLVFRPTPTLYRTPRPGLFLCGASTPPGGGVHGMAGFHAAKQAVASL